MTYRATLYRTVVHAVEIEFEGPPPSEEWGYDAAYDEALAIARRDGPNLVFTKRFPAEYEVLDLEVKR